MLHLFFAQTGTILFSEAPALEVLEQCFAGYELQPLKPLPEDGPDMAPFQGRGFSVVWNGRTGELAQVDIQPMPWPDDLGGQSKERSTLAASSLGAYGAGAEPGGLARAVQQAWHWPEAAAVTGRHTCFVRLRLLGAMLHQGETAPPAEALAWVLQMAERITKLSGALAWYCPSAEKLLSPAALATELAEAAAAERPAVNATTSVRVWNHGDWRLLDTAGMEQYGLPDMEYAGPAAGTDVAATALAFNNLCLYLIDHGDVIESGNSADGPAGRWRAIRCQNGVTPPSRQVLRWKYEHESAEAFPPELKPQQPIMPNLSPQEQMQEHMRMVVEHLTGVVQAWQRDLPAYRAELKRFQQTADYLTMALLAADARSERALEQAMRGAVLIPAFPAIGNSNPDLPVRPALVVGTFDPRAEAIVQCALLADRMGDLYVDEPSTEPEERAIQLIVQDDRYVPKKRVRIPEPAADGFEIYAFNVVLTSGPEDNPLITPLFTAPGPGPAPAVTIPLDVLEGKQGPAVFAKLSGHGPSPQPQQTPGVGRRGTAARPSAQDRRSGCKRGAMIYIILLGVFFLIGALNRIFGSGKTKPASDGGKDNKTLKRAAENGERPLRGSRSSHNHPHSGPMNGPARPQAGPFHAQHPAFAFTNGGTASNRDIPL